jgi:uncharacterized protein YxjI
MSESGLEVSLTGQNELSIQQVTGFMSNDFAIEDAHGRPVASIRTTGSAASRFFAGNRQFEVTDLSGTALFQVHDPMTWGRDRYRVTAPDGSPIAELVQRTAFLKTSVQVSVVDGTELRLEGNFFDHSYRLLVDEHPVAAVDRTWAGFGKALLGHSRYALQMDPGMLELVRYAVIGSVISLDLIRDKAHRRRSD